MNKIGREWHQVRGRVGIYKAPDRSDHPFPAWYGLAHLKTCIAFPMMFEWLGDACAAASQLDIACDWDAYVEGIDIEPEWEKLEGKLRRDLFYIADNNNGALLPGEPLPLATIALLRKSRRDPSPPEMTA